MISSPKLVVWATSETSHGENKGYRAQRHWFGFCPDLRQTSEGIIFQQTTHNTGAGKTDGGRRCELTVCSVKASLDWREAFRAFAHCNAMQAFQEALLVSSHPKGCTFFIKNIANNKTNNKSTWWTRIVWIIYIFSTKIVKIVHHDATHPPPPNYWQD